MTGCHMHIAGPNQFGATLSICGVKTGLSSVELDCVDRLPSAMQLSTETRLNTIALSSMTMAMTQRRYCRLYDKFLKGP